jgi:hypothetical protein
MGKELRNAGYDKPTSTPAIYQRFKVKQKFGKYNTENNFNKHNKNIVTFKK